MQLWKPYSIYDEFRYPSHTREMGRSCHPLSGPCDVPASGCVVEIGLLRIAEPFSIDMVEPLHMQMAFQLS